MKVHWKLLSAAFALNLVSVQAGAYLVELSSSFDLNIPRFPQLPGSVNNGVYDSVTGSGHYNMTLDLSVLGGSVITFDQGFDIDSSATTGNLYTPYNCFSDDPGSCAVMAAAVVGTFHAQSFNTYTHGFSTDWMRTWSITSSFGDITFENVTAAPVPAGAWLFGSALLSLVGRYRYRK